MTAETLKPFITPTTSENYVPTHSSAAARHHRSCYFLAITASVVAIILTAAVMGISIWNTMRVSKLETEVQTLNKVIESMQKRLGLTYLDDLNDLEKGDEENNNLIDELPDDEDDDDDDNDNDNENISGDDEDDDEEYYVDYDDLINKFRHYQETEDEDDDDETNNTDSLGGNNVYDDFGKFNESKKKKPGERKPRSVAALNGANDDIDDLPQNEKPIELRSFKETHHKSIVAGDYERRRSPMRPYSSRKRKFPTVKSAKDLPSVQKRETDEKPAAHFHLTHKVPYHNAPVIDSYHGDMYIGKRSWTNEQEVDNHFQVENGVLTVQEPGLYYVYAQICYHNNSTRNGFIIFHGDKPFLQCLSNIFTNNVPMLNTCHTSGLIYLRHNEHIHIRDFNANREAILKHTNNRSYFGLIKI